MDNGEVEVASTEELTRRQRERRLDELRRLLDELRLMVEDLTEESPLTTTVVGEGAECERLYFCDRG